MRRVILLEHPRPEDPERFQDVVNAPLSACLTTGYIASVLRANNIQEEASVALWKINDIRAVEPLIAALKNENSGVSETVAWVLKVLTGVNFGVDHAKWHEWWEKDK